MPAALRCRAIPALGPLIAAAFLPVAAPAPPSEPPPERSAVPVVMQVAFCAPDLLECRDAEPPQPAVAFIPAFRKQLGDVGTAVADGSRNFARRRFLLAPEAAATADAPGS